jgi:outer membrane protein assembly factor BamB
LGDSPSAQLLWSYDAELAGFSSPIVVDGVVYVGTENRMNAFDAISGQLRWRYQTEAWFFVERAGGVG